MAVRHRITVLRLAKDYDRQIRDTAVRVVAASGMAFAAAAASQVHVWTGYTQAIWEGVSKALQPYAKWVRGRDEVVLRPTKPWYYPPWPVSNPNYDIILEDPDTQRDLGLQDAQDAFDLRILQASVVLTFRIPEYPHEVNYAIREDEWQSLAAGRFAFAQKMDELLSRRSLDIGNLIKITTEEV